MSSKTEIKMTEGNIAKKMVSFAWPLMISGWLQLSFNLADFIVCGQFVSQSAVGAIGATGNLIALIVDLFIGFAVGVNVAMGNAYGADDKEKGQRVLGSATALAIVSGLFLCVIGLTMSKTFLTLEETPADIIEMSNTYMMIYFGGIPFLMLYNFGSAAMRGMGDTKRPFIYLTIGGVLNVGLNLLFVISFSWGVAGLAYATIISEGVSALLVMAALFKNHNGFAKLSFKTIHFYRQETVQIIRIGLPAGIQGAMFDIANVIIQSKINSFGTPTVSGDSAAGRINGYVYVGMDSFVQAGVAFISANAGAKNVENIKKSFKWCLIYACGIDVILAGLEIIFRDQLLEMIVSDPESIRIGELSILITMSTHLAMTIVDVVASSERGLGYSTLPALTSFIGICVVRLIYIYTIFELPSFHSMEWLYATYPISWAITAVAHSVCYLIVSKREFKKLSEPTVMVEIPISDSCGGEACPHLANKK